MGHKVSADTSTVGCRDCAEGLAQARPSDAYVSFQWSCSGLHDDAVALCGLWPGV
jgi:hypothetical protein